MVVTSSSSWCSVMMRDSKFTDVDGADAFVADDYFQPGDRIVIHTDMEDLP